jgi:hypothetical protein
LLAGAQSAASDSLEDSKQYENSQARR